MIEDIDSFPDFRGAFGDKRIDKRATEALNKLVTARSSSIRQVSEKPSDQKAFYRLLENEKFSEQNIEQSIIKRCGQLCQGRDVLCIQDTSEINLEAHRGRLRQDSGVGSTSNKAILGFFIHPCLVVDAKRGTALGYSHIDVWHRPCEAKDRHERLYKQQPIEAKESYKWIETASQSASQLASASQITVVADREADIYDLFGRYGSTGVKLLIRASSNRHINDGTQKIIEHLAGQPVQHSYDMQLMGDIRKGTHKRVVQMEVKWAAVRLCKPDSCKDKGLPSTASVTVVEVKQKAQQPAICWRLYTTHEVKTVPQALEIIGWYKQRWYIEQAFRLLKMQGFHIESSQLEKGWAIRKLTLLAMVAILRIMQMYLACEDDTLQPLDEVFTKQEQQCMYQLNEKLQGQTTKLRNPYESFKLKWAAWIIACLGGWKPYSSQRKPGPIVLHRGFIKFYQLYEGWILAHNFFKDVGTQ